MEPAGDSSFPSGVSGEERGHWAIFYGISKENDNPLSQFGQLLLPSTSRRSEHPTTLLQELPSALSPLFIASKRALLLCKGEIKT